MQPRFSWHLSETIKQQAVEINVKMFNTCWITWRNPCSSINELIPAQLGVGQVPSFTELASWRSFYSVYGDSWARQRCHPHTKIRWVVRHSRLALSKTIAKPYISDDGLLHTLLLVLNWKGYWGVRKTPSELAHVLEPNIALAVIEIFSQGIQHMTASGLPPCWSAVLKFDAFVSLLVSTCQFDCDQSNGVAQPTSLKMSWPFAILREARENQPSLRLKLLDPWIRSISLPTHLRKP